MQLLKYIFVLFGLFLVSLLSVMSAEKGGKSKPELIVYTYDSLMAKGGLGPEIVPEFEKKCGCVVRVLSAGDGAQLVGRLELDRERGKPTAHVVMVLDQHLWYRAKELVESWGGWRPKRFDLIRQDLRVGPPEGGFLPFDYGVFAMMSDQLALKELKIAEPHNLNDLLSPHYRRNIILEDPRTSTPGLAFLLYTKEVYKDAVWEFWKNLRPQWLTMAPGWDGAYGLFLKKEAPLVWSYTTSQAYHVEHGDKEGRYKAIIFEEGQPVQIEGAALVKGSLHDAATRELAKKFLEFMLSEDVQAKVPKKNWMLPVVSGTRLPESFRGLPAPKKIYRISSSAREVNEALSRWNRAVVEGENAR